MSYDEPLVAVYDSQGEAYQHAFSTFLAHTDQKDKARDWLDQTVAALPAREVFFDAGAGNGKVTAWFVDDFLHTVALEPNPHLRDQLREVCPAVEILPDLILAARPSAPADFILCSHVFYYIDQAEWRPNLEKLTSFLKTGGLLVIILQNPGTDCMRMLNRFHGRPFDHSALPRDFAATHGHDFDVAVETVECWIKTPSLADATTIAEFMLNVLPLPNPPPRRELQAYVEEHFAQPGGGYRFSCSQDFLQFRRLK